MIVYYSSCMATEKLIYSHIKNLIMKSKTEIKNIDDGLIDMYTSK